MDYNFFVNEELFKNEKLSTALKNRVWVNELEDGEFFASLIYPTFDVEINVYPKDNGSLELAYFSCIKGNVPYDYKGVVENNRLMWQSDDYTGDTCTVDFSKSTWKEDLEKEMVKVADSYAKKKGYSFDKPNF